VWIAFGNCMNAACHGQQTVFTAWVQYWRRWNLDQTRTDRTACCLCSSCRFDHQERQVKSTWRLTLSLVQSLGVLFQSMFRYVFNLYIHHANEFRAKTYRGGVGSWMLGEGLVLNIHRTRGIHSIGLIGTHIIGLFSLSVQHGDRPILSRYTARDPDRSTVCKSDKEARACRKDAERQGTYTHNHCCRRSNNLFNLCVCGCVFLFCGWVVLDHPPT